MDDKLKGGLADNMTPEDLARKHHQFIGTIEKEIEMGIKVEMEHTNSKKIAREIAMDHIAEHPDYYSNEKYGLNTMEKKLEKESIFKIFNDLIKEEVNQNIGCGFSQR